MTMRKPGTQYPSESYEARKARGLVRISLDLMAAELATLDRLRGRSSRGVYVAHLLKNAAKT